MATKALFFAENPSTNPVPPVSAEEYLEIPIRDENIDAQETTQEVDIITEGRQPRGDERTAMGVTGTINSRLAYGWHDKLFEAALFSPSWAMVNGTGVKVAAATIDVDVATKTITASATTPFAGLAVGDWVRFEKAGWANHGLVVRISKWTSTSEVEYDSWTQDPVDSGVSPETGVTVRSGERLTIGTQERYNTLVKKIVQAGASLYIPILMTRFNGFQIEARQGDLASISFDVTAEKIVPHFDGTFSLDSAGEIVASGGTAIDLVTLLTSGSYTAALANRVLTTANRKAGAVMIDGVPSAVMTSYGVSLQNNIAGEGVMFHDGNKFIEPGRAALNITAEAIVNAADWYLKFLNQTEIRSALYIVDSVNQGYLFDVPRGRVRSTSSAIPNTGLVRMPIEIAATLDASTDLAFQMIRFGIE